MQAATPSFAGVDDFYHVGWSRHLAEQGIQRFPPQFPWLPHTILNERDYVDHHLLYHVLLSFFVRGDPRMGGKVAAVAFASAAMGAFGWLLWRWGVSYPLLWVAALLTSSHPFLYRMSMVRAQSASLAFLLVAVALASAGRGRTLLFLGILYVWLYDAFPLLLAVVLSGLAAELLVERRLEPRPLAHAAAGLGLGLLLHPYFPLNLQFTYRHLAEKIFPSAPVPVGREWAAYDSRFLLESSGLAFALLAAGLLLLLVRGRKASAREMHALLLAGFFLFMTAISRRFIEYYPPFALLAAATFLGEPLNSILANPGWRRWVSALAVVGLLAGIGAYNFHHVWGTLARRPPFERYAGAACWLAENTQKGSIVFTSDWDDFPELFYFNRHNRYLAGLDPTYSSLHRPFKYLRWVEMTQGDLDDADEFFEVWGASYAFTDRRHPRFFKAMEHLRGVERVYRDDYALLYRIEP